MPSPCFCFLRIHSGSQLCSDRHMPCPSSLQGGSRIQAQTPTSLGGLKVDAHSQTQLPILPGREALGLRGGEWPGKEARDKTQSLGSGSLWFSGAVLFKFLTTQGLVKQWGKDATESWGNLRGAFVSLLLTPITHAFHTWPFPFLVYLTPGWLPWST
jgi:hypothetical protein